MRIIYTGSLFAFNEFTDADFYRQIDTSRVIKKREDSKNEKKNKKTKLDKEK